MEMRNTKKRKLVCWKGGLKSLPLSLDPSDVQRQFLQQNIRDQFPFPFEGVGRFASRDRNVARSSPGCGSLFAWRFHVRR